MWTLLLGCHPDPTPTTRPDEVLLEPIQTWSAHVESVAVVSWTAPEGATSWVEYGRGEALDLKTPTTSGSAVSQAVLGLAAGASYTWRAVSDGPDGRVESAPATLVVPSPPESLPWLVVDRSQAGAEAPTGFVLGAVTTGVGGPTADAYVVIWNGDGEPVWWHRHEPGHISVSPSIGATPGTIWWDDYDETTAALTATGWRAKLDGSELRSVPLPFGHHTVLEPLPDQLVWPARDTRPADTPGSWVTADRLYEAPVDGTASPSELVNLYEDLFGGVYAPVCTHPAQPYPYDGEFPVYEWSHLNSVVYLADRDAYLIHLRWIDTVLLVDRTTGAILWRLGGPLGEFTWADGAPLWSSVEDTPLSHAHFSDAWTTAEGGGLVAFDNGSHRTPEVSSIVELGWDEGARTVTEVFRWEDPEGRFAGILGDVRKLPGGDYLASWSTIGELDEVAPDGTEVWHATTAPLRSVSRIRWIADLYAP